MKTETARVPSGYVGMNIVILDVPTTLSRIYGLSVFMESGAIQEAEDVFIVFGGEWPGQVTFCR